MEGTCLHSLGHQIPTPIAAGALVYQMQRAQSAHRTGSKLNNLLCVEIAAFFPLAAAF
jgi:hypothetical protein